MKELTKENIQAYAIEFSNMFGIDFEEKLKQEKSKPTPIGDYFFTKDIFGVYKLASEDKIIESLVTLYDIIQENTINIRIGKTCIEIRELSASLLKIADILEFCEFHSNKLMDEYSEMYKDHWLFKGHNIKDELKDLWIYPRIEQALNMKLFKTYSYHIDNPITPPKDSKFQLNPNLYIVDSINSFLRYAKKENTDEVRATYILKIEDVLLYSYFALVIQYKGNVWVGTDKMMFANPDNKYHRRDPYRSREDHFDYLDLPYFLLDNIEEIRKQTKVPVPNSGMELHIYKMVDFNITTKAFMHQLSADLVSNLENETHQKISSYEDVILALPSGIDVRNETIFPSDERLGVIDRIKEIETFLSDSSTELATINKDIIINSEHYDPEWLATPESLYSLNNWIANNKIKKEYEDKFEKLYPIHENSMDYRNKLHKEFAEILKPYVDNIFQYAFVGDKVITRISSKNIEQFGSGNSQNTLVQFLKNNESLSYSAITIRDNDGKMTYHGQKGLCQLCKNHTESKSIKLNFSSAKQLQIMFGLSWEQIPDWFKLYKFNNLIPYHGNSILDNVNPLAKLQDNVSYSFKNGFNVTINMCGWCYNKLVKKYRKWDRALISYDISTNNIIIEEYPEK